MNISNISCDSSGVTALSAHDMHNGANNANNANIATIDTSNSNAHHLNAVVTKRRRTRRSKKRKWLRSDCCSHTSHNASHSTSHNASHNASMCGMRVCDCHTTVRSCALPLAPYNTTQFIINDHCNSQMDFDQIDASIKRMHKRTMNMESEERNAHNEHNVHNDRNDGTDHNSTHDETHDHNDDDYSSDDDEHESNYYLQQQFHEAYDNIHAERLNSMTKTELVEEYLQLEDRVEDLERRLKESREMRVRSTSNCEVQTELNKNHSESDSESDSAPNDAIFRQQFKKLCEENERLRCDNDRLQRIVDQTVVSTQSNHSNHINIK